MKRTTILAVILLLVPFVIAQAQQGIPKDSEKKSRKYIGFDQSKLGKPMFVETENGLKAQVWLVSRADHDRMMEQSSATRTETDMPDKVDDQNQMKGNEKKWEQGSTTGSKYEVAIVVITDTKTNSQIETGSAELNWTSPSGKSSKSSLTRGADHYYSNLDLSEHGAYKLSLRVTRDGKATNFNFDKPVNAI